MAKTYIENIKHTAVRNKIFSFLNCEKQKPIFEVIKLSSGDYLPITAMTKGEYEVYGGGGKTNKSHNKYNVSTRTLGIGRVGARCGCVFEIHPNSWVTDNSLFATDIDPDYCIDFLIEYLNFKNINQFANTAAQPVISIKRMAHITIPIIGTAIQDEIVNILKDFENSCFDLGNDKYQLRPIIALTGSNHSFSIELNHQLDLVKKLRSQLLQDAIKGKLVLQNPDDEPASILLQKIKAEKEQLIKEKKLKKEKELPPIKPEEIPFEIPKNWVWCRLGALRDIRYSLSYGVLVPGNDVPDGIPFIRVQDLDFADKNEMPIKNISPVIDKQFSKTRLVGGEILICVVGSIGKVALASDSWIGANIARAVCRYMPNPNISRQFLFYCLTSPFVQNFFQNGKKSINPTLNVNILETTLIPLPPIKEQNCIVKKVNMLMQGCDQLEASIEQSQQQNEQLLQQVLREALTEQAKAN